MFAWVFVRPGCDFGRQQVHDGTVLVSRPCSAALPQKAGAGALLAAEAARANEQARREPLEADWHFIEPTAELVDDPIDHAAAHQRLANGGLGRPMGTMREQI